VEVEGEEECVDEGLTPVLQLAEETLVATVDTLRVLELLYRVNADVEVLALDVVLILRQFDEATELALDPAGRPLRVLFGEIARSERRSWWYAHGSCGAFGLVEGMYPGDLLICLGDPGRGKSRTPRRPRLQVEEASVSVLDDEGRTGGALRPMRTLDTLLAVVAITWEGDKSRDTGGEASSTGEIRPAAVAALASAEALFLPKLSFHFDGFLVTGGRAEATGGEAAGGSGGREPVSNALGIANTIGGS
jgi:hypothetical protein